jgi:hypothetical protein
MGESIFPFSLRASHRIDHRRGDIVETILGEARKSRLARLWRNGGLTPSRVLVNGLNRLDSFEILGRKVD